MADSWLAEAFTPPDLAEKLNGYFVVSGRFMPFRHRSSMLALVLSAIMVLAASAQSMHEQLADHGLLEQCEYCLQALDPSGVIPPLLVALPALMLDLAPQTLLALLAPRRIHSSAQARAPPVAVVSY